MLLRSLLLTLASVFLVFGLACGNSASQTAATVLPTTPPPIASPTPALFPVTITSSDGAPVTFQQPPERIVAFDTAAVEILFALGEGRRVAGTHSFVDFPPEANVVPRVGDAFNVNFEKVAELKPDLVYIFFDRFVPDLQRLGFPVLYQKWPATFGAVEDQMRMWGQIIGNPGAGEALADRLQLDMDELASRTVGAGQAPRVYLDLSPELWTSGSGSLLDEIFRKLNAINVFSDVDGAMQVSAEELVFRAPDVIISTYPGGAEAFAADPRFKDLPAMKNGRICQVEESLVSVPGPRLAKGAAAIAKCLYPDRF